MSIVYLTLEEAMLLCRKLDVQVRDIGLLDSALHRPQASFAGIEAYPTIALKAAALLHSLAKNHALVDGNKRLAWLAVLVFLHTNGHRVTLTHAQAFGLVMDVAGGNLDLAEIAAELRLD